MQLARNLFPERIPGQRQTMTRKLLEARVAGAIERAPLTVAVGRTRGVDLALYHDVAEIFFA